MNHTEIQVLQKELNLLIEKGYEFSQLYELSTRLDRLITRYYKETNYKHTHIENSKMDMQ